MYLLQNATTPPLSRLHEAEREDGGESERIGEEADSDLEREASDLYQWTQSLSFEDV